jgi:class 3 adenylate cyclase/tetratricopeptide (TPR) repeat protein
VDVRTWLEELGLGEYAQEFAENHIDAATLPNLTVEDLKDIGVRSVGHRRRLVDAIAALRQVEAKTATSSDLQSGSVPAGEHRQVTVLFADLADFTGLSAELGAERTHGLLNRYFDAVDSIVQDYGGSIDKHIGDNVMAVFGAPVAHSDDPERSVRAAFDIHQAMTGLSTEFDRSLQAHIGIASGQVVASGTGSDAHREYTVTGESVNLASRLQDKAEGGETLISDGVWRSVSRLVDCSLIGESEVKGFPDPVKIWRMNALRPESSARDASRFVGRRSESRQFIGVVEECLETGVGQAILLRGEAGMGKTRLAAQFAQIAEERGFATHRALVLDFGVGKGQDAIRILVRSFLEVSFASDWECRQEAIDTALENGVIDPNQRVFLNDLLDLPQPVALRAVYDAMDDGTRNKGTQALVARLIRTACDTRPVLITVDDIHWADPLTLAHLANMAQTVASCAAVLVMTSRIEGDPIDRAWRASLRGNPLATIDLGPLRESEALEFAGDLMDASGSLMQSCVERSGGNPLFLEQLLRNAEESANQELPATIQSLVQARIDRLESQDKEALQAASVIGQRFGLDALRHVIGSPDYGCDGLIQHHLVGPEGEDYLFAHALVREGVYGALLSARKHELHGRAAVWFAERDPVLWARHLDYAEDAQAPEAYLVAARTLAEVYRYGQALELVRRGLEIVPQSRQRFALEHMRGDLLRLLGEPKDALAAFEVALEHAEGDSERCEARIGIAASARLMGDSDRGIEALRVAEDMVMHEGADRALAQIYHYRGAFQFAKGNVEACLSLQEKAFEHGTRAKAPEWIARALSGLGDGHYAWGRIATALDYFQRCLAIAREQGFGEIEVSNRYMVANARRYMNDFETALKEVIAAKEMAVTVGNQRAELFSCMLLGEFYTDYLDTDRAKPLLERGYELAESLGNDNYRTYLLHHLARCTLVAGAQRDEARRMLAEALEISRRVNLRFIAPRILATTALVTKDPAARKTALAESEGILGQGCISHNHFWFYRDAMEASLMAAEWDEVERYAVGLETYTRAESVPWCEFFIVRGRALVAFGRGRRDEDTVARLRRLSDEGNRMGSKAALSAIETALAGL